MKHAFFASAVVVMFAACSPEADNSASTNTTTTSSAVKGVDRVLRTMPASKVAARPVTRQEVMSVLAELGFDDAEIRRRAEQLVPAAARLHQAQATHEDLAVLADTVVMGTAGPWDRADPRADGFASTVPLRVHRVWRSDAPLEVVAIRQASGRQPDGTELDVSGNFAPIEGQRYVIFASNGKSRHEAQAHGPAKSRDTVVLLAPPWPVQGETVATRPPGDGPTAIADIDALFR
ncbi:hypothetical protein [Lysobacter humi (ex Lee et al. 2017)]